MKEQINIPVSFNPKNVSHSDLLSWIDAQTTNRSAFIRETMMMRKCGLFGAQREVSFEKSIEPSIDNEEALRIIQI